MGNRLSDEHLTAIYSLDHSKHRDRSVASIEEVRSMIDEIRERRALDAQHMATIDEIVNAAAERFDKRPEYRASVSARAELRESALATELKYNAELQEATRLVMGHLLDTGHDKLSVAYHTLEHVLADLEHDRAALHQRGRRQ